MKINDTESGCLLRRVIPGTLQRLPGIVTNASAFCDPGLYLGIADLSLANESERISP